MDETDAKLLRILEKDGRASFTKIGEQLGMSEGAIRKRVEGLKEEGVLKRFTIEFEDTGVVRSLVLADVNTTIPNAEVATKIVQIPDVKKVYETSGDHDLLVILTSKDIAGMNAAVDEVRAVRGVEKTNTALILKEWY